jgi:hypothetical protein
MNNNESNLVQPKPIGSGENPDRLRCEMDQIIFKNDFFINERTIKDLLINQKQSDREPPPSSKYTLCEVDFITKPDSHLERLLKHMKPFKYNDDLDLHKDNRYHGPLYVLAENSVYVGQMNSDVREGKGIQFFQDGSYYEGYFVNDSANRKGRLIFCDGDMFIGELTDNSMNGTGVYYKKDGSKYTGTFINDLPQGEGKEEWEDGSIYKGNYSNGCKNAYGEFKFANGTKYVGSFENDIFNGRGTLQKSDGTSYEGNWLDGGLKSPAKINYPNGNYFEGEVSN